MRTIVVAAVLAVASTLLIASHAGAAGAPIPNVTVALAMTTTVSAPDLTLLESRTQQYFADAESGDEAFYALLTPDFIATDSSGKNYSAGKLLGTIQGLKLQGSGMIQSVRVLDAHQGPAGYDEVALVRGTADIIDSAGARAISTAWVHKIMFVRDDAGQLLISRDVCVQKV